MPGGGLTPDGKAWRAARRPDWLLPKAAVEAALRGGMEAALRAAAPDLHAQVPDACWREGWWVDWQPAGSGQNVVKYLARYVRRTAISDERIITATDEAVTFSYIDSETQQYKERTLPAEEFMRRYLQHVPPPGQHRGRYLGWMIVETLLSVAIVVAARHTTLKVGSRFKVQGWAQD